MNVPDLRPLGIGEILDVSVKLYTRNALELMKAVAVVVIPVGILGALILVSIVPEPPAFNQSRIASDDVAGIIGGVFLILILETVGSLLASGAAFKGISDAYMGRKAEAAASLQFAGARIPALLWITFLLFLIFFACFVPAIFGLVAGSSALFALLAFLGVLAVVFLGVLFSIAVPTLLVEDARGRQALARSAALIKGRWWRTFVILLVGVGLIPGIVGGMIGTILGLLTPNVGSYATQVFLDQIASTIGSIITTPFAAAVLTVLYFDLRVRREGFDLQLLAQRVGTAGPPSFGTAGSPSFGGESPGPSNRPPPPPPPPPAGSPGGSPPPAG